MEAIRPRYFWVEFLACFRGTLWEPIAAALIERECCRLEKLVAEHEAKRRRARAERRQAKKAQAAFKKAYQRQKAWAEGVKRANALELETAAQRALDFLQKNPGSLDEFRQQPDPIGWIMSFRPGEYITIRNK